MSLHFTLIYRTSTFADSKALDFETRNVFKKHKMHAQYMTQRKMKVLSKADALYSSLLPVHQELAHSNFVIFVMPNAEANYTKIEQIDELITSLKKETLVENEDFYFVGVVYNNVCITQEQLKKLIDFSSNNNAERALNQLFKNSVSILNYTIKKNIAPLAIQFNYIERTISTLQNTKYLYI
jgi:hypothetical protein